MAFGNYWDSDMMLSLYIYDHMKKKNMHELAELFAKEANLDLEGVSASPEGFLAEWWAVFWAAYFLRNPADPANKDSLMGSLLQNISPVEPTPEINQQGAGNSQEIMMEAMPQNVFPVVATPGQSQQMPGNYPIDTHFGNVVGQPSTSSFPNPGMNQQWAEVPALEMNQHRAGNFAVNTEYGSMLGQPSASLFPTPGINQHRAGKCPINPDFDNTLARPTAASLLIGEHPRIPYVERDFRERLLDADNRARLMPSSSNAGYLQRQAFTQSPPLQVVRDNRHDISLGRSTQMEPTLPAGQSSINPTTELRDAEKDKGSSQMPFPGEAFNISALTTETAENQSMAPMAQTVEKLLEDQLQHQLPEGGTNTDGFMSIEDLKSFLLSDDDMSNSFSALRQTSSAGNSIELKEVGSFHESKTEILRCHFSSDGRLLACVGSKSKITVRNMDSYDFVNDWEGHFHIITDVRFRPSSAIFATSSFDRTVQIWDGNRVWDGNRPYKSLMKLSGHTEPVLSLDFHPRQPDLLCSSDSTGEIRLWNVNEVACKRISKGASRQVRFQPEVGKLLAAAAGNTLNLIDFETNIICYRLEGHVKDIRSICWDTTGNYIASVSSDGARVWSTVSGGKCISELPSSGNKFESCIFHPSNPQLLVIGSQKLLKIWNPTESNETLSINAHDAVISGLAASPQSKLIASVSHDQRMKLWR